MAAVPSLAGLVLADLDGTLLDHRTYSWEEARPAIDALAARGVPLVPCTSKTLAELAVLARALGLTGPGIVENGAAIVWRLGRDDPPPEVLGAPYARLREALAALRAELALPLVGFGDVDAGEVARRTGLDPAAAARARERLGDEPFWSERPLSADEEASLERAAAARGLALARGGRFFHLGGGADKGSAARRVIERLAAGGRLRTAAFGDAANDRPLLEAVERPFAVRRPDGQADPALAAIAGVRVTGGVGPAGFREGIERLLAEWDLGAPPARPRAVP